jgi:DNA-dependent RNA polymerase auxiliary subunit epsilon
MEKMSYLSGKLIIKIMTTFLIIVATLFFNEPVLNEEKVLVRDTELRQYTIEFLTYLNEYDVDYDREQTVNVRFNKLLGNGVAGAAYGMEHDEYTMVFINPMIWKYLNGDQKRWLVYHELAHDMFDMRHFSSPIMHPQTPTARKAKKDFDYNVKKLFNSIKLKVKRNG